MGKPLHYTRKPIISYSYQLHLIYRIMLRLVIGGFIFTGAQSLLKVTNRCSSTNTGTLDIWVGVTLFFFFTFCTCKYETTNGRIIVPFDNFTSTFSGFSAIVCKQDVKGVEDVYILFKKKRFEN